MSALGKKDTRTPKRGAISNTIRSGGPLKVPFVHALPQAPAAVDTETTTGNDGACS